MNLRTPLVSVALVAAGALAGCGDDNGSEKASTPAPAPAASTPAAADTDAKSAAAATTPQGKWAQQLCTAMVGKAEEVQPPNVNPKSPEATQKALIAFFSDVGEQIDGQVATIEKIGPPPGSAAGDWEKAVEQLRKTNAEVAKIRRGLRAANPQTSGDVDKVVADLGKQMGELAQYQGPVAELSKNKALADAIAAEPACAKVS